MRVAIVAGTRPEAIKMAPLVREFRASPEFTTSFCHTEQHTTMLEPILEWFDIPPDVRLGVMLAGQSLNSLFSKILDRVDSYIQTFSPDIVLVHGDTTTASATAIAAFHRGVRIGHVEAGLRTNDLKRPWPEEFNRQLIDVISDHHFAPTERARRNLINSSADDHRIHLVGNSVIDALLYTRSKLYGSASLVRAFQRRYESFLNGEIRILVTGHRRENFGSGMIELCSALRKLSQSNKVRILYPVHLNPSVREPVMQMLGGISNIELVEPTGYEEFVFLMNECSFIISDSGGIQEEAPTLGKPVLVTRDVTERPEAVEAGACFLVGADSDRITNAAASLISEIGSGEHQPVSRNPFGDGNTSRRILDILSAS